jgi:hypothetical protein
LAKKINYKRGLGLYYFNVSPASYYKNDFTKCEFFSKKAIAHFLPIKDNQGFLNASISVTYNY